MMQLKVDPTGRRKCQPKHQRARGVPGRDRRDRVCTESRTFALIFRSPVSPVCLQNSGRLTDSDENSFDPNRIPSGTFSAQIRELNQSAISQRNPQSQRGGSGVTWPAQPVALVSSSAPGFCLNERDKPAGDPKQESHLLTLGKKSCSSLILYSAILFCPSDEITQSMNAWPISFLVCGCFAGLTSMTPYWLNRR